MDYQTMITGQLEQKYLPVPRLLHFFFFFGLLFIFIISIYVKGNTMFSFENIMHISIPSTNVCFPKVLLTSESKHL